MKKYLLFFKNYMFERKNSLILTFLFSILLIHASLSQTMTVTRVTTDETPSALLAGSSFNVIFVFSVSRTATNTATDFNSLVLNTTSDPNDYFSSVKLYGNTATNSFLTATEIATATLNATDLTFPTTTYQAFANGASESNKPYYFYIVATVKPDIGSASGGVFQLSFTEANVGFSSGSAAAFNISGTDYDFDALAVDIGSLNTSATHGVTASLLGGSTAPIFGFSLTGSENGSQVVEGIKIHFDTDPTLIFDSFNNLQNSLNNNADATGNSAVPLSSSNVTDLSGSGTGPWELELIPTTPISISTAPLYYFLFATIKDDVPSNTSVIQASLTDTDIDVNYGEITGSAIGIDYSTIALNLIIASLNNPATHGVATDGIAQGVTNRSILGFSLTSNGTQNVSLINVTFDEDPALFYSNFSLVSSTNANADAAGNTTITLSGTPGITDLSGTGAGPWEVSFDPMTDIAVSSTQNFFVYVDVLSSAAVGTDQIQASMTSSGISSNGFTSGLATGINYNINTLEATLLQLTTGIEPSPMEAGSAGSISANAILGFSLVSNGNQTVEAITLTFDITPDTRFASYELISSPDNSFATTAGHASIPLVSTTPAPTGSGPFQITLQPVTPIDISAIQYLFVVATVEGDVTPSPTIRPSLSDAGIDVNNGAVLPASFNGNTYAFEPSKASTISIHSMAGTTSPINYAIYSTQTATSGLVWGGSPNSTSLANFRIRDGGGSSDNDTQDTKVTGLNFTISNPQDLEQVAIFYGTSISNANIKVAEQPVGAGTISVSLGAGTLSQALVAADNSDAYFTIRVTFKTSFASNPDNRTHTVTITSATLDADGSQFTATPLTGATTGSGATINNMTVEATKLIFVDPATLPIIGAAVPYTGPEFAEVKGQPGDKFNVTVVAVNPMNLVDLDRTSTITLNTSPSSTFEDFDDSSPDPAAPDALALVAGIITFDNLTIASPNTYDIGATGGGLIAASSANGTSFSIVIQTAGVDITPAVLQMCKSNNTGDFESLPTIILEESDNGDFDPGAGLSFLLILPSGWEFNTSAAGSITYTGSRNISSANATFTFLGNTIAKFNYSVSGTNKLDAFTFSGLEVRNTGGINGVITRGGTGVIKGCCDDTKPLGTLTTSPSSPVTFSVESYPGQPAIPVNTINFPKTSQPIVLNGEIPPGTISTQGTFSGIGVTEINIPELGGNRFVFNPSILSTSPPNYAVTFTYAEPATGCLSEATKVFSVFDGAINGLEPFYCKGETQAQTISINPTLIPPGGTVVQEGGQPAYSLRIPSQKNIIGVENNLGTLTITIRNHGFANGDQYWIYIANSGSQFSGPDAPYGYIYKLCTVSNVSANRFDIDVNVIGTWDKYYGRVELPANYNSDFSSVVISGTKLLITTFNEHGYVNGARPYMYTYFYNPGLGYLNVEGFFEVENATANTFEISYTVNPLYVWQNYGYAAGNWYRVTSFVPDITLLNRKLINVNYFELGYFYIPSGCTFTGCDIYYTTHETPVQLFPPPVVSFLGLNPVYCENNAPINLIGSEASSSNGSFTISPVTASITDLGNGTASFTPATQPFDTNLDITYFYTDVNGCTGSISSSTIVRSRLAIPIANDTSYCQVTGSSQKVFVKAKGVPSAKINWYSDAALTNHAGTGETFDTQLTVANNQIVTFYTTQVTETSCESLPKAVIVTILQQPNAAFTTNPPTICVGKDFTVTGPTSSGTPYPKYTWDFGSGPGTVFNRNDSTSAFTTVGNKEIILEVEDANQCKNSNKLTVSVNDNPVPSFTFNRLCDNDPTQFAGSGTQGATEYSWNFYYIDRSTPSPDTIPIGNIPKLAGNTLLSSPFGGNAQNPVYVFPNGPGDYLANITAYNNLGCFSDSTRQITILQYLSPGNYYDMASLDGGKGYWQVEDVNGNSTWEFAVAQKAIINSTDNVWVTNATTPNPEGGKYRPNDRSYVNSPCLNLTAFNRPVLSMDYIINTGFENLDGAVLEYSTNGGVTWTALGNTTSGSNWLNTQGFFSGDIGNSQVGWSGNLPQTGTQWVEGKHILDNIPDKTKVRFRLAFGSDGAAEFEGFAFTNFKIQERNRLMLVENFSNSAFTTNNDNFNDIAGESVRLQYHLSFPEPDNISSGNQSDPSARAAYYGIPYSTEYIPRGYIDGILSGGAFVTGSNTWITQALDSRALSSSPYTINIEKLPNTSEPALIKIKIDITQESPVTGTPVLHVAVVEKSIPNGTTTNEFVVRKFLPSAAGSKLSGNTSESFTFDWRPDNALIVPSNLAIVAFIQDQTTKEVHQAAIDETTNNLPSGIITGTEDDEYARAISHYPNPANQIMNIELPAAAIKTTPVQLHDTFGRVVYQSVFEAGERSKTISTSSLADGIYMLQLVAPQGSKIAKKIMVKHQ